MPGGTETTFHDVGRIVALWVSAFEILVHPGDGGTANRDKVFGLIEQTPWADSGSFGPDHDTGGKTKVKRSVASWLYQHLYDCRNDFLHGNPVGQKDLLVEASERLLSNYAAPLYRIALTAFLPLKFSERAPSLEDLDVFGAYKSRRISFKAPQENVELALLTALQPA